MTYEIKKLSEIESPSEEDLQYGLDLLLESEKISANKELMKNLESYGKKKAGEYRSISQLREKANEMAMNPAQYAAQEDEFLEKKKKRLEKKAV